MSTEKKRKEILANNAIISILESFISTDVFDGFFETENYSDSEKDFIMDKIEDLIKDLEIKIYEIESETDSETESEYNERDKREEKAYIERMFGPETKETEKETEDS